MNTTLFDFTTKPLTQSATQATMAPAAPASAPAAPRVDLYASIHKALRLFMGDTLAALGRIDVHDSADLRATLDQLDSLLGLMRHHVHNENEFVHPAIDAVHPGGAQRIGHEHLEHLDAIAALEAEAGGLRRAPEAERTARAHRLYRHLALFVADNLAHMNVEETVHNAMLWDNHSDAELLALHQRILAAQSPTDMQLVLRWMAPSATPQELLQLLTGMRDHAPVAVFEATLRLVRAQLDAVRWAKLGHALGLPFVDDCFAMAG